MANPTQVLDAIPFGVIAVDAKGRVAFVNALAERLLGRSLAGQPLPPELVEGTTVRLDGVTLSIDRSRSADDLEVLCLSEVGATSRLLQGAIRAAERLTAITAVQPLLDAAADTLVADLSAALARIWLYDAASHTLTLRAAAGSGNDDPVARVDVGSSTLLAAACARSRRPSFRNDAVAAFPMLAGGELLGVVVWFGHEPLPPGAGEVLTSFVATLTTLLAAIDRATREERARNRAEAQNRRATFLVRAHTLLAGANDTPTMLQALAELAVPQLGDWCAIDLPAGTRARRVAAAHIDPARALLPYEIQERYPADPALTSGFPRVLRTGEVEYWPEVPESMLRAAARDEHHLRLLRSLGFESYMCVPMPAGGRPIGAITFVSATPQRRFDPSDLGLAEELARAAGRALERLGMEATGESRQQRTR